VSALSQLMCCFVVLGLPGTIHLSICFHCIFRTDWPLTLTFYLCMDYDHSYQRSRSTPTPSSFAIEPINRYPQSLQPIDCTMFDLRLPSQPVRITTALWPVFSFSSCKGRRLSLPEWLLNTKTVYLQLFTYLNTDYLWRRAASLIYDCQFSPNAERRPS